MTTIISDSGCDLTPELRSRLGLITVPLTLRIGEREYVDDENLDVPAFIADMQASAQQARSASPPPGLFQEAIEKAKQSYILTLSAKLSSTYDAAKTGLMLASEEATPDVHIFDTKTASSGGTLALIKLHQLLSLGLSKEQIVDTMTKFIDGIKTFFVLERFDNLINNGRITRLAEKMLKLMHLRLICGDDGNGNIALHAKTSEKKLIGKLASMIKHCGRPTEGENLVISHCLNPVLAEALAEAAKPFNFSEIFIVPTGGVASLYADEKGLVFAY